VLGDDADENYDAEPPLEDNASENHHDGELSEVGLILFSSSRHRRRGCRDDDEVAKRGSFLGDFFGPRPSEFGVFF